MTIPELLSALAELRGAIAQDIRVTKGAGGTQPLPADNVFVRQAAAIGWETESPPTIYGLLKAVEFAHAQISIEVFRDGASETAGHMLAAMTASGTRSGTA
ncbi:MAG: hypothetical protein H7244_01340 [Herminiimonas sp.]|nr:hypothetical protein [Herminiimonas sp.]